MTSIVIELQRETLDKESSTTNLLRKALLVAKKLKQTDIVEWIEHEMNGYPHSKNAEDYPPYRKVFGVPQVFNPYHGYQPIIFANQKQHLSFSTRYCFNSVSELEHMISQGDGRFEMNYDADTAKSLMRAMDMNLQPTMMMQSSSLVKILDSVKTVILNWTLRLEEDNILGENLTFSQEDKTKAASAVYNTTNFFGNVSGSQIQQGTESSIQQLETT
jgi:AbiTii